MTDQQATALVELAACPDHRREAKQYPPAPLWVQIILTPKQWRDYCDNH